MRCLIGILIGLGLVNLSASNAAEEDEVISKPHDPKGWIKASRPVDQIPKGSLRAFTLSPDGKKIALHLWESKGRKSVRDRVGIWDVKTGEHLRTLVESEKQVWDRHLAFDESDQLYVARQEGAKEEWLFDISTGMSKTLPLDDPEERKKDEAWEAAVRGAGIDPEKVGGSMALGDRKEALVSTHDWKRNEFRLYLLDPEEERATELFKSDDMFDAELSKDGRRVVILRDNGDPLTRGVWGSIELWDVFKQTRLKSVALKKDKQLSTADMKATGNLRFLFLMDYLVQTLAVFDLKEGRFLDFKLPPTMGFEITADGRTLAAMHGTWINGTLREPRLVVYSLGLERQAGDRRK